jgi:hypothetical protein
MKKHAFHKDQHKLMSPEIINNFALVVAQVIKNKVNNGMSLQKAKKETFDELNLINRVIQKLALHYINSPTLNVSTNFKSLNYNRFIGWQVGIISGILFVLIIVLILKR